MFANGNRLLLGSATFKRAPDCQLRFNLQQVQKTENRRVERGGKQRLSGKKRFYKMETIATCCRYKVTAYYTIQLNWQPLNHILFH